MEGTFYALMNNGNDRAVAITLAALLEGALESALSYRLGRLSIEDAKDLFGGNGPLGSFSAKNRIGAAIKILGPNTRKEINCIRDIRNAFAHATKDISFATKEIGIVCERLRSC
jgi:hypothetical protein